MTMGDVPSQGIAAALTPNPTERTNVVSISNTFKQVGFSACAVFVPNVCLIVPEGSKVLVKKGEQDAPLISTEFLFVGILTAIFGCVLFSLIRLLIKSVVTNASSDTVGFREMFAALSQTSRLCSFSFLISSASAGRWQWAFRFRLKLLFSVRRIWLSFSVS
jgi:Na+/melibiose symporter-like transporter